MKAENKLNSNLTLISKICCIKVGRSQLFMILPHSQWEIFFRNTNFLKIFINNPQNLYYPLVLNTQNENYMKVWYPQLRRRQHGKPSKSPWADSAPPPALLGLRLKKISFVLKMIYLYGILDAFNPKKSGGGGIRPRRLWRLAVLSATKPGVSNLHVIFILGV